jgi:integrase
VFSEPKTERSRRTVPLSAAVVAMLRKYRAVQPAEKLRVISGRSSELVFTTELGRPVDPRNLLRVIELAAESAGVEHVGVPTLWHSAAITWLESGIHQGRRRPARALVNLHHGRRLRPHQRRNGALGSRRVERGPRVMTAPHSD